MDTFLRNVIVLALLALSLGIAPWGVLGIVKLIKNK